MIGWTQDQTGELPSTPTLTQGRLNEAIMGEQSRAAVLSARRRVSLSRRGVVECCACGLDNECVLCTVRTKYKAYMALCRRCGGVRGSGPYDGILNPDDRGSSLLTLVVNTLFFLPLDPPGADAGAHDASGNAVGEAATSCWFVTASRRIVSLRRVMVAQQQQRKHVTITTNGPPVSGPEASDLSQA